MKYDQRTGKLYNDYGIYIGQGYSGFGPGKNNPEKEEVKGVGPIPKGKYTIGKPFNSPATGPFSLPLLPFTTNIMHGRYGFLIHGDNADGTASHGCIILNRNIREMLYRQDDKIIEVY